MTNPQPKTYKGFPDKFLKTIIETGGEKIDISGKNYYEILGIEEEVVKRILGKGNNDETGKTIEVTIEDGLQYPGGPKKYTKLQKKKVLETISYFYKEAARKHH